jgi:hypothetical protein
MTGKDIAKLCYAIETSAELGEFTYTCSSSLIGSWAEHLAERHIADRVSRRIFEWTRPV